MTIPSAAPDDRAPAARPAPFRPVPEHDASLLRLLFRGARFPDTEWWSHAIHVLARSSDGTERELSLFANVQLLAEPLRGELSPAGVLAIRDVRSGEVLRARSRGRMGSSRACRYAAPGWLVLRLDPRASTYDADALGMGLDPEATRRAHPAGAFVIQVEEDAFSVSLVLGEERAAVLGQNGWVDYNPCGEVPFWTSATVRIAGVTGTLLLENDGEWTEYRVTLGHAHSEHQCLVPSASVAPLMTDVFTSPRGLATLFGVLRERPRWHWFHAPLGDGVHLSAHRVWNPRNGRPYRDHATLLGPRGPVDATEFTCSAPRDDGSGPVPDMVVLGFDIPDGHGIPPGRYEVVFRHRADVDWMVPFTMPLGRVCRANEAHCSVQVHRDGRRVAETTGGHETIDLVSSLVPDE